MIPKRFVAALQDSIRGFFQDNCATETSISPVSDIQAVSAGSVIATIGFTCDMAKGVLLVVSQTESLRTSHPMASMGAPIKDSDLNDWAGEIANQTLGRFKNSLLPFGISLNMSVPSVVRGSEVQLGNQLRGDRFLCGVKTKSHLTFGFGLDIVFARGFDAAVFDELKADAGAVKKEGDGFLF